MIVDELVALLGYKIDDKGELAKFNKSLDKLEQKARAVGSAIRLGMTVATAAMAGGFAMLGKGVVDTSAKFEGYLTTLETIEGSAAKAKESLAWVTEFAKTTPFDIDQATESFVKLKAYGIDPLKDDTLKVIGDTASAMGKDLMQAVEAWADAMTGENERLKEFGVKAKKEGDKITYTWTEQGKEVKKTIKDERSEILKFLNETMGKKFGGAMERQSKTWNGMMSNLGDSWIAFKKAVGDAGFFENLKGRLRQVMDLFEQWTNNGTAKSWADRLSRNFIRVSDMIFFVASRIARHMEWISKNFEKAAPYIKGAMIAFAGLLAVCFPLITALGLAAVGLDDFLTYLQGGESAIGQFIAALKQLLPFGDELNETFAKWGTGAVAAFAAALLLAPKTMLGAFGSVVMLALRASLVAAGLLGGGWVFILAGVGLAVMAAFWDEIKGAIASNQAQAQAEFGKIKEWFLAIDWSGAGVAMMEAIWSGMQSIGGKIKEWFTSLIPDWAKGFFGNGQAGTGSYSPGFSAPQGTPGAPTPSQDMIDRALKNAQGNSAKTTTGAVAPTITNDHRQDNREYPVTVSAPVTVTVNGAEGAGAAAGNAVGAAIAAGVKAQPSRMQTGPAQ